MGGTYVRTSLRRKRTPGDAHRRFTFFRPSFLVFINSRERPLRIHRQQDHGIRDQVRRRLMLRSDAAVLLTEMVYPELPVKEMCSILEWPDSHIGLCIDSHIGSAHRRFTFFKPSFLVFINSRRRLPCTVYRCHFAPACNRRYCGPARECGTG